jgi:hypothetical protein
MDSLNRTYDAQTGSEPRCFSCAHMIEWPYCFAFLSGDGIPQDIRGGKFEHTVPYPGDHGIQFTPIDSPYNLSENAVKRLLTEYRGQRIMPNLAPKPFRPIGEGPAKDRTVPPPEPEYDPIVARPEPTAEQLEAELLTSCERGDVDNVRRILDVGVDVDVRDSRGNTALMVACRNCQIDVVKLLLERGADVHARNSYARKAMDVASDWGYPSIIELLRASGSEESEPPLY